MVDFAKVIAVRERKAGAARSRENAAFQACEAARERVADAREEMEDFADDVKDLEVRLLSELLNTRITVHDVARIRDRLKKVEEHAQHLVDQVKVAQAELAERELQLEEQRAASVRIQSKLRRITEIDKKLTETKAKDLVRQEDAKMDDFADTIAARGRS